MEIFDEIQRHVPNVKYVYREIKPLEERKNDIPLGLRIDEKIDMRIIPEEFKKTMIEYIKAGDVDRLEEYITRNENIIGSKNCQAFRLFIARFDYQNMLNILSNERSHGE